MATIAPSSYPAYKGGIVVIDLTGKKADAWYRSINEVSETYHVPFIILQQILEYPTIESFHDYTFAYGDELKTPEDRRIKIKSAKDYQDASLDQLCVQIFMSGYNVGEANGIKEAFSAVTQNKDIAKGLKELFNSTNQGNKYLSVADGNFSPRDEKSKKNK